MEAQVATLRSCLDDDLLRYLEQGVITLDTSDGSPTTPVKYITALKSFIRSQQNPLLDRIKFFKRVQEPGESFDDFYTSLKEIFIACDFNANESCDSCKTFSTELLRDRIITGINCNESRHKLLASKDLTLDTTLTIIRAEEAARITKDRLTTKVDFVHKKSQYKKDSKKMNLGGDNKNQKTCYRCGKSHPIKQCPAYGQK